MTPGRRIVAGTLAVVAVYAASFGLLWGRARSPAPPKPTLSARDLEVLGFVDELLTRRVSSAGRDAQRLSAKAAEIQATVKRVSERSDLDLYGDAAGKLLSGAQLALNNQLRLEDVQNLLAGELKLCDLVRRGLRQGIGPRALMETLRQIEQGAPKIEGLIEEADMGIAKTRFGLGVAPQTLFQNDQWEILGLINVEQQSNLADQKELQSEIVKTAEALKKLAERVQVTYQTLSFPF